MFNYAVSLCRIFGLFTIFAGFTGSALAASDARVSESYGRLPLQFEANDGQVHKDVRFLSRGPGYGLYLTPSEAVLVLTKPNPAAKREGRTQAQRDAKAQAKAVALRMSLVGATRKPLVNGHEELPGKANYFIGKDRSKWRTNVPTYAKVHYREVYPGIDLVYYGNQRQLEYDFVVAPGADPNKIVLGFKGADKLRINAQGDLMLHAGGNVVRQHKPAIYQEVDGVRTKVEGGYVLKGTKRIGFKVAAYDTTRPLVIDPVLSYSTFLGGGNSDHGVAIAVDATGSTYVTGNAAGFGFPATPGAFQPDNKSVGGTSNTFVAKLDPTGSALVYSTFLGGNTGPFGSSDSAGAIAVDADGNAYVTGSAGSFNFPVTAGAFQTTRKGGDDAYVTKLNPTGSALVYSTLLGGSSFDMGFSIAVDASGNAYVAGGTRSANFPTTAGAFQTAFAGGASDTFVTKLNPSGSALVYSTYLGGSGDDGQFDGGIAVDASGNAYVTGGTSSANFPTTAGAFQTTFAGGALDAFVTKLDPTGSALAYSTYLGGSGSESRSTSKIAVDTNGNAYVTGGTDSTDFPTTVGAYQVIFGGGASDAFVTKLDPTGSALVYSTYLGGIGDDNQFDGGITVDAGGSAYLTGMTTSINFPTTAGAFQPLLGGEQDAFMAKLSPDGSALVYSTYLGGSNLDMGRNIAVDANGNAYVIGSTFSHDFPTTPGAFNTAYAGPPTPPGGGFADVFVVKFIEDNIAPNTTAASSPAANAAGWNNSPVTVTLSATDSGGGSGVKSITYSVNAGAANCHDHD